MAHLFEKSGPENTLAALQMAFAAAKEHCVSYLVIATTQGHTLEAALPFIREDGPKVIFITHNSGFKTPGQQQLDSTLRQKAKDAGAIVHTGTMVLRNVGSAIRRHFGGSQEELINASLRMICQGAKVGCEIAAMACDAGWVPPGEIITVSGTSQGADTVMRVQANSSNHFFDIRIIDIVAKPR